MKYFDFHCDVPLRLWERRGSLYSNDLHVSLERAEGLEAYGQVFAIYVPEDLTLAEKERRFYDQAELFLAQLEDCAQFVTLCTTAQEAEEAYAEGKVAAFLSIENGGVLQLGDAFFDNVYDLGVRIVGLAYNEGNVFCTGCGQDSSEGLTKRGVRLLGELEERGMLVDVSHISEAAFWDVADNARRPFLATHSCAYGVTPHRRNLRDDQLQALFKANGLVGLALCPQFLSPYDPVTCADVVGNVFHLQELGGADHIAFGADFDGVDSLPEGIAGIQSVDALALALYNQGVEVRDVNGICFENAMRFLRENLSE